MFLCLVLDKQAKVSLESRILEYFRDDQELLGTNGAKMRWIDNEPKVIYMVIIYMYVICDCHYTYVICDRPKFNMYT